ncbi:MAG: putative manganese transporter [Coriobacteriaceae bacterium]|nr:putative manganese transporter [Coriobacteriaceae bacterium]
MDLLRDVFLDAVKDSLSLVPFLFITYLALEALEHAASDKINRLVRRAGVGGPVVGAALGVVPQCGFSAMAATLYAGRVITLGTLVAVFLSTSDEMLPMLVAEQVDAGVLLQILGAKFAMALITGVAIDALLRLLRGRRHRDVCLRASAAAQQTGDILEEMSEAGEGAEHIHRLCEHDHCGCDEDGRASADERGHDHAEGGHVLRSVVLSAISHTLQVTAFIFLVTFCLVFALQTVGADTIAAVLTKNSGLSILGSALVGLIPNCSASVVITQLYLEGVLGFAPMMAGLLVSVGVGYLVLFRTNHSARENVMIVALTYAIAVAWGFGLSLLGL